jgi:hypothetical protein
MRAGRTALYLYILLLPCLLTAQPGIDYAHRVLIKNLEKEGIEMQQLMELNLESTAGMAGDREGKFFVTGAANASQPRYLYAGRVNSCRAGGCSVPGNDGTDMSSEYFDYFILFDKRGWIERVHVFNYRATHGYEICSPGWLKQFSGYNGTTRLEAGKTVDGISGATISVHAITRDVHQKTAQLHAHIEAH